MSPLFVVVNGGYRTGSTVAFRVARQVLAAADIQFTSALWDDPAALDKALESHTWSVAKTHVWAPTLTRPLPSLRLIYTYRDPYDVAASLLNHRDSWGEVLSEVQRQQLMTAYHKSQDMERLHAPLLLRYRSYYDNPRERVVKIAEYLGVELSDPEIDRIAADTGVERVMEIQSALEDGRQDDATMIQANHIGAHRGKPGMGVEVLGNDRADSVRVALEVLR